MPIRRLVMLTKEYPSPGDPSYSFVEQLAKGFAAQGVQVTVIAPLSLTRALLRRKALPARRAVSGGVTLLRPLTLSFSGKAPGLNHALFKRAAKNALRSLPEKPDALYGHFVALSGASAGELGRALGIPSFLGYGESSPALYADYSQTFLKGALAPLTGVISVSSENARELRAQRILKEETPVGVFPNGVDPGRFRPMDRDAAREQLGFPKDAFIVSFVGGFIPRKGIGTLCAALKSLPGARSIFIGRGPIQPDAPDTLFQGSLPNDQIPLHLAASDVFALPTRAEGCCNAIVEALSMGLPVVSSDLPFNDDILSDANSLRVDPESVPEIAAAIRKLMDDPALREALAAGARASGQELTISSRVQKILHFMEETAFAKNQRKTGEEAMVSEDIEHTDSVGGPA